MEEQKNFPWELLPWAAVVLSVLNLWRTIFMSFENVSTAVLSAIIGAGATLGAAVIGGAIALIGQWRQAKRDGKKIDGISSDTSQMKPTVQHIEKIAEHQAEDLRCLVSDLEHRKRLEAEFPQGMSGRDLISIGSNRMIEENAQLNRQYQELNLLYLKAQNSVNELQAENAQLRSQISELKAELQGEQRKNPGRDMADDLEIEP